jgi:hypothetical protein
MNPTKLLLLLAILLGACLAPAQADGIEGTWGGKWDDTWPVFISVHAGNNPGEYTVTYFHMEYPDKPSFESQTLTAKKVGDHYETERLVFKLDEHGGMIYGRFDDPRMANLVRIAPEPANPADLKNIVLENYGWKPGAIPAADALTKIRGTTTQSTGGGGMNLDN